MLSNAGVLISSERDGSLGTVSCQQLRRSEDQPTDPVRSEIACASSATRTTALSRLRRRAASASRPFGFDPWRRPVKRPADGRRLERRRCWWPSRIGGCGRRFRLGPPRSAQPLRFCSGCSSSFRPAVRRPLEPGLLVAACRPPPPLRESHGAFSGAAWRTSHAEEYQA